MKMAAYPNAFRVYGDYGYGSVIFNDLKLPKQLKGHQLINR